jgi:GNAT superfamily N-acetyltransferase
MSDMQQGSTRIDICPFDPLAASVEDWATYQAYRRTRQEEDYPGEPTVPDAEFERILRRQHPLHESRRIVAVREGALVGNLILEFRRDGSPGSEDFAAFVFAGGGVLRAHRRQGVGRALLAGLLSFMQSHGKTTATMKTHLPEGHAFMAAIGAAQKYQGVENRLAFDGLDWDELARWQARATTPGDGLTWETHAGRVPLERLAPLMAPFSALINEQPLGSLEMPRIRYELQGYVSWYEDMDRRGGEHFLVLLRHGDDLAAMCDASWDARFPDRVYQALTAVARPWRSKGLAKGVKAAMLNLIRARHPEVRTMITTNAEANAPMLSINQRLGFAVHRQEGTYQISRETLARFAAAIKKPTRSCAIGQ